MYQAADRPRYLIPGLAGVCAGVETYSWPLISIAILIRGGGALSVDRLLGREI